MDEFVIILLSCLVFAFLAFLVSADISNTEHSAMMSCIEGAATIEIAQMCKELGD